MHASLRISLKTMTSWNLNQPPQGRTPPPPVASSPAGYGWIGPLATGMSTPIQRDDQAGYPGLGAPGNDQNLGPPPRVSTSASQPAQAIPPHVNIGKPRHMRKLWRDRDI